MALIVEDGTGLANAESYISVLDADAYFTSIGNTTWGALSPSAKENYLRQGTQYLDMTFTGKWKGLKIKDITRQALAWPRMDVLDSDGFLMYSDVIPITLKRATAEAALRASSGELVPDVTSPGYVAGYRIKVGPIEEETKYGGGGASQEVWFKKIYLLIRDLLAPRMVERC